MNTLRSENQIDILARRNFIVLFLISLGCCSLVLVVLFKTFLIGLLFFVVWWHFLNADKKKVDPVSKAVLITGCDRGFGLDIAHRLRDAGFQVFAGCLSSFEGGKFVLSSEDRFHCLKMNVTSEEDVKLALEFVTKTLNGKELWAIINNAGLSKGSDIEMTSMSKITQVLDVNLMGTIRVTKAFLPLLRKAKGRVINVASAAARIPMPGFLPYSVSKHAIVAFSDGLRMEMRKFGVAVVTIEPWIYRTKLSDTSVISRQMEKQWQGAESSLKEAYDHIKELKQQTVQVFARFANPNIGEVLDAMQDAVTCTFPPYYYRPGKWYLNTFLSLSGLLPQSIVDFILCHFIFRR